MSFSISFSMKFLVLLRFIDFNQWHVNLGYAHLLFMTGMPRIMNMQNSAWCPARVSMRIASAKSPFTYMSSSSMEILEETTEEVKSSKNNKGKQPKTRKKRSPVWNDFEQQKLKEGELPEDVKAMCLHCGELYLCHTRKYGITNLKNHLGRCTPYLEKKSKSQTHITFAGGDVNKMMAWKFDQNKSKRALAHMIVVDELPFSFVENSGFRHYQRINQPLFDVPCRGTITKECLTMYLEEKNKLRETLQKNIGRVCLTTDGWTSIKKKSYMALTAHFIDNEWNLVKKVLNFRELDGHRGIDIGKGVESCLSEWGFDNILSISVDNASANDSAIDFMKLILEKNYNFKWIKKWNSTYAMLEVAHVYEDAFARYDLEDVEFGNHIRRKGHSVPTSGDWIKAKKLCHFLKVFYEITLRISLTKYVTSHTLVNELATIRALLRKQLDCDIHGETPADKHLYDIAKVNSQRFPILSLMARDVLAIPISTVASESVFSTSGRVLDSYRSSLGDKTIECLICTQDWLRIGLNPQKDEDLDTIAQIEKALMEQEVMGCLFAVVSVNNELFGCCE
ncbi:zinc finger BED domain-containing protein RICESLEEPER 2-like protein [Tanacetum coccineum]